MCRRPLSSLCFARCPVWYVVKMLSYQRVVQNSSLKTVDDLFGSLTNTVGIHQRAQAFAECCLSGSPDALENLLHLIAHIDDVGRSHPSFLTRSNINYGQLE